MHEIDCHILTLPHSRADWLEELKADLEDQPINQHWLAGRLGDLSASRIAGWSTGSAPFASSVDHDDRILPGVFEALRAALVNNPSAPFAWAGERWVNEDLTDFPRQIPPRLPHGVKLYRRELLNKWAFQKMSDAGMSCEVALDLHLIGLFSPLPRWPIYVPMVGRLWRLHGSNGHRLFNRLDQIKLARIFGFRAVEEMQQAISARIGLFCHPKAISGYLPRPGRLAPPAR